MVIFKLRVTKCGSRIRKQNRTKSKLVLSIWLKIKTYSHDLNPKAGPTRVKKKNPGLKSVNKNRKMGKISAKISG
jgi:hypothetical protein